MVSMQLPPFNAHSFFSSAAPLNSTPPFSLLHPLKEKRGRYDTHRGHEHSSGECSAVLISLSAAVVAAVKTDM
jgi:hypothetical protein